MHNRIDRGVALFQFQPGCDKGDIMIAQYDRQALAYRVEVLECFQRTFTPVDQVACQPEPVARRVEIDLLQGFPEGLVAALDIAYRPDHGAAFG
jgi:hypothetical protein